MIYKDIPNTYRIYISISEKEFNNLHEISQETVLKIAINEYKMKNRHKINLYKRMKTRYIIKKVTKLSNL